MRSINFNGIFKVIKTVVKQHTPEILIGLGIGGMITTTVLAVKATPDAISDIDDRIDEINEELRVAAEHSGSHIYSPIHSLPTKEVVKVCWKHYVPAAVTGITSVVCIVGGTSINLRRNAALATAYKISESTVKELQQYKEKVVEVIGEDKQLAIEEQIDAEKLEKAASNIDLATMVSGNGPILFFDCMGGQFFKSDKSSIQEAINRINHNMNGEMYVSLNDFYDEMGMEQTIAGRTLGWNTNGGLIEPKYSTREYNGVPVMVLSTRIEPKANYDRVYG